MATCFADCDQCQWPWKLAQPVRYCCSQICLQIQGDEFGYCQRKDGPPCNSTGTNLATSTSSATATASSTASTSTNFAIRAIPFLLGGLILVFLVGFILWYRNHKKIQHELQVGNFYHLLTRDEIKKFIEGNPESAQINKPAHEFVDDVPYDRGYEIPEKSFTVDERDVLGAGEFGIVLKGKLWNQDVALKTTKPNVDKIYLKALLTELKLLIHLGQHENIVSLLGAFTTKLKSGNVYIFLEYCPFGNLLNYLRNIREGLSKLEIQYENILSEQEKRNAKLDLNRLLNWSIQIANGLRFLSDKKVIHGDIATRNILVFSEDLVKLTDFGLSRRIYDYTNYVKKQQQPLPWRWMAIESLRELSFSTQSDVWSFGVTLWEIFTLGDVPYPGLSWSQDFIYKLTDGLQLSKPMHADDSLYELMKQCWNLDPKSRPTFHDIHRTLKTYQANIS